MSSTTNPIALITGANRGIGFTLARTLARDHGFHILLGSRTTSSGAEAVAMLQSEGFSVEGIPIDLTSDASIIVAANTVAQKYGKLDLLVNNAGILLDFRAAPPLTDLRRTYQDTFNTNIFGTAVVTESFLPLLSTSSNPRIVFVSSTMGSITERLNPHSQYGEFETRVYCASKAALNMLCATTARQPKLQGWKINACCPGGVNTNLTEYEGKKTTEEAMPNLVRLCTLGVEGETGTFTDDQGVVGW